MRVCTGCKQDQPITAYKKNVKGRDGLYSRCRACNSAYHKERYATSAHYRGLIRETSLRRKYGLTSETLIALRESQSGLCASCSRPLMGGTSEHIDHDHATGRVRGILCNPCNTGIGKLGDTIQGLENALAYLRAHR